jgi:glycine cleavage system H lipoate-binding protein
MQCPFLKETRVRWCRAAGIRKPIPETQSDDAACRCLDERFRECRWAPPESRQAQPPCPHLEHDLVQYCEAAPLTRFVPFSEPLLTRCGSDAHKYCDFYLDILRAARPPLRDHEFAAPEELFYTRNHWWIDLQDEEMCHVGVDAFLARLLGDVERAGILTPRGAACPAVVFTCRGTDFTASFPAQIRIEAANPHLRVEPRRMLREPYTMGWLFRGRIGAERLAELKGQLMTAAEARRLMEEDARRVNETLQSMHLRGAAPAMADGGLFEPGLLGLLEPEEALRLFHETGSPAAGQRR